MMTTSSSDAEAAMETPLNRKDSALAPKLDAPQQKPRPLPLFLSMLRSETAASPQRLTAALAGLRRYQEAPRSPPPDPAPAIAEAEGAVLRDYSSPAVAGEGDRAAWRRGGGAGSARGAGPPILVIPSLINPPNILDLGGGRSLLRWLAARGHRPLLVDWGWDVERRRALGVAGHVEHVVLPLIERLGEPPAILGYCL